MDQEQLIKAYLPIVRAATFGAMSKLPSYLSYDDLFSEGVKGLLSACARWDEERADTFSAYVATKIKGAIYDYLRENDPVPRRLRSIQKKVVITVRDLNSKLHREPTEEEVCQAIGITAKQYHQSLDALPPKVLSLDHPENTIDIVDETEEAETTELREFWAEQLWAAINELNADEQKIIIEHYYRQRSLTTVAHEMNRSEARASQIKYRAIAKLKALLSRAKVVNE